MELFATLNPLSQRDEANGAANGASKPTQDGRTASPAGPRQVVVDVRNNNSVRSASDLSDDAPPPTSIEAGALRICTLNVGGRNTNSFEFLMAGDGSELGQRWSIMYETGMKAVASSGPGGVAGLSDAVAEVLALAGQPGEDALIASLLKKETWSTLLKEAKEAMPKIFNALNMASLGAGRPSPLERPENVNPKIALLEQWLAWLKETLPKQRAAWEERLRRKTLPPLPTCLAAMLLFDAMCAVAMQAMHASAFFDAAILAHRELHAKLAFTSDGA